MVSLTTAWQTMENQRARTYNGAVTNASSNSKCLDFFFNVGSMRGKEDKALDMFLEAMKENEDKALRILQWLRDVRGGAGEREIYRYILGWLELDNHEALSELIFKTPEIGRWDDIFIFESQEVKNKVTAYILNTLAVDDQRKGLLAKWMPRKGSVFNEVWKKAGVSPKVLRKTLVHMTDVVETKMCAKQWDRIDFSKLPSLASARYQAAFERNAEKEYGKYIQSLKNGETKINAGAVYPYDVLTSIEYGNINVANEQWKALPDYLEGAEDERILPLVDVSGSMGITVRGNKNLTCLKVAISLGLYLSERNKGIFKDTFMTFSQDPELITVRGSLFDRACQMKSSNWGFNTNLNKVFRELLNTARHHAVPEDQMPTTILILSDMEFDNCCTKGELVTNFESIRKLYRVHGYKMPKLVFWNLNGRSGNVPVTKHETGTALVSGFSPSIMKAVLSNKEFTPESIMNEAIMIDRYKLTYKENEQ